MENGDTLLLLFHFLLKIAKLKKTFDQDFRLKCTLPQKQFYLGFPALISPLKVFIFELVAETFLVLFTMQYACSGSFLLIKPG